MPTEKEISSLTPDRIGLCATCRFMIEQGTKRGAVFFRCARADEDESFSRYPPMPVLACGGHERRDASGMS